MTVLLLLVTACAASGETARVIALEERLALVEGRVAGVETGAQGVDSQPGPGATASPAAAEAAPTSATDIAKEDLAEALDVEAIQAAIDEEGVVDVEVVTLDLDPVIDLITATIRPLDGAERDVAWESAKALAPLFSDLGEYAPALDLQVGETRCICSAELMKGIADGEVARDVWEGACGA